MTINTRDKLIDAMANTAVAFVLDKPSIANTTAGQYFSHFQSVGIPPVAVIPSAVTVFDSTNPAALQFAEATDPEESYLSWLATYAATANSTLEIHDRLVSKSGLNGTLTGTQDVSIDLDDLLATSNLEARIGLPDYSEVCWWLEWQTQTGSTAVSCTVNVTYDDESTDNLVLSLAATRRVAFLQSINAAILTSPRNIMRVNTVSLSATTGAAGNFGVVATRRIATASMEVAGVTRILTAYDLGLPKIEQQACLMAVTVPPGTSSGAVRIYGKSIRG